MLTSGQPWPTVNKKSDKIDSNTIIRVNENASVK